MGPPPARSGLTEGRILARRLTERRSLRLPRRAECAFPLHCRPGGVGRNPPPGCGALWRVAQLGKCARATPPARLRGGLRWDLQAPAWGLIARKGAVWAEGLADGAPWAKPRHHQAASCGLRRCRKLRVRRNPLGVEHVPELGDRQEACDGTVPVAADHRREATIRKLLSAPFALTRPTCGHTCLQAPPARRAYPVR